MIALLLNHLWQSSLCVAGAGLLALALRRNGANVRFWLWFAASVKFLLPFAVLTAAGAYLLTPVVPPQPAVALIEPLVVPLVRPFSAPTMTVTMPAAAPSSAPAIAPATAIPAPVRLDLESVLLAIWLAGFLIVTLRWLVRWSRLRALLREAVAVPVDAPIAVKFSFSLLEPGLAGILRPVILLPQGIEQQLSAVELKAVLAHELCHWRRHDNLLASVHMLVEALFWFFPLVWWLGARLNAERERACDESVLAEGNDPQEYAEGILKVCRAYLQSPLACVAGVSGGGLKKRIDAIMENRLIPRLNAVRKLVLSASAALVLVPPLIVGLAAVPVAQIQAKAAQVLAPIVQTPAAARAAPNEPAPSQTTASALPDIPSQPENLTPPSPDLPALSNEPLTTPVMIASSALPATVNRPSNTQLAGDQSTGGLPTGQVDLNERSEVYNCTNGSVTGRVISAEAIHMRYFTCERFDPAGGLNFEGYGPASPLPPYGISLFAPPEKAVGVTMTVQLANPADVSKMHPGERVTLRGDFRATIKRNIATKERIAYLSVANAKVLYGDPFARRRTIDQPPTPQAPAQSKTPSVETPTDQAANYDKAAVPSASAALKQAQQDCKARLAANEIKNYSEMAACGLAAEHIFFTSIKLKKMDVFEAYADSYQALAADRDAGISKRQADRRGDKILREFYANCNCRPRSGFGPVPRAVSDNYQGQGNDGFVSSTGLPTGANPFP